VGIVQMDETFAQKDLEEYSSSYLDVSKVGLPDGSKLITAAG
jgi:hypothetical protein